MIWVLGSFTPLVWSPRLVLQPRFEPIGCASPIPRKSDILIKMSYVTPEYEKMFAFGSCRSVIGPAIGPKEDGVKKSEEDAFVVVAAAKAVYTAATTTGRRGRRCHGSRSTMGQAQARRGGKGRRGVDAGAVDCDGGRLRGDRGGGAESGRLRGG